VQLTTSAAEVVSSAIKMAGHFFFSAFGQTPPLLPLVQDPRSATPLISKVYDIVKGDTTKPDETKHPKMPSTPPLITGEMSNADTEKAAHYWTQFNVQMNYYNMQLADFNCKLSAWTDGNSQAMGIFNRALDIGIWDQVKDMTAAATWTWLGDHYAKSSITELLEHFRYIKDYWFA